jgi:hypothetical protein
VGQARVVADDLQRYEHLADRVSRLSITERSADGALEVTVSANGMLTNLVFHPEPQLAEEIMECVRRAQSRIPDLLRQAMFDTIGTEDPSAHLLLDDARRRFPELEPEPPARATVDELRIAPPEEPAPPAPREPPRSPRPLTQDETENDWAERAVMEDP